MARVRVYIEQGQWVHAFQNQKLGRMWVFNAALAGRRTQPASAQLVRGMDIPETSPERLADFLDEVAVDLATQSVRSGTVQAVGTPGDDLPF